MIPLLPQLAQSASQPAGGSTPGAGAVHGLEQFQGTPNQWPQHTDFPSFLASLAATGTTPADVEAVDVAALTVEGQPDIDAIASGQQPAPGSTISPFDNAETGNPLPLPAAEPAATIAALPVPGQIVAGVAKPNMSEAGARPAEPAKLPGFLNPVALTADAETLPPSVDAPKLAQSPNTLFMDRNPAVMPQAAPVAASINVALVPAAAPVVADVSVSMETAVNGLTATQDSAAGEVSKTTLPPMQRTPGQPGWDRELGSRIQWMADEKLQRADLKLNPARLGPIEIRVSVQNDQTSVTFVSQHAVVREALEAAIPRLREMMADAGMNLSQTSVSHQSGSQQQDRGPGNAHSGQPGLADDRMAEDGADVNVLPNMPVSAPGLLDLYA